MEEQSVVGRKGKISSVVARENITIEPECVVYGSISCEDIGRTVVGVRNKDEMHVSPKEFSYLGDAEYLKSLSFESLEEYENAKISGFRKEKELQDVVIPSNASDVPKSMFFSCKALEKVVLPESLKVIGDYAFADCEKLNVVKGLALTCLEKIGTSAFENCKEIKNIEIPSTVKYLRGAAFSGCASLEKIVFSPGSVLEYIGDHCFCGCKSIEEISIPDTVKYIGISAFRDCTSLKKISIPENCAGQPGITELQAMGAKIEVAVRSLRDDKGVCEEAAL